MAFKIRLPSALRIGALAFACLALAGCATGPEKSGFLTGHQPTRQGRYMQKYWVAEKIPAQTFSRIYVEPVDVTRIQDAPGISALSVSNFLQSTVVWQIPRQAGWNIVEAPETATAKLALAITYMTPGSVSGRAWAAELGAGHAFVQVDGRLTDTASGAEIACFSDRRRDSGSIGFEDFGGNAGPRLVRRMLETVSSDFLKETAASAEKP